MCMAVQPGMVFKAKDTEDAFLCVSSLRWALLAWPVERQNDDFLFLDPNGKLSWHFIIDVEQLEATVVEPVMVEGEGILGVVEGWKPVMRVLLGSFSEQLTFVDLRFMAFQIFGKRAGNMVRLELLKWLCEEIGGHDFAESVVADISATRKRKLDDTDFDTLAGFVLEQLDKAEATDFDDIKAQLKKKEKSATATQWQQWRKEAWPVEKNN